MAKIKIRYKDPSKSPSVETRREIMKIIQTNKIPIYKLQEVKDGYVVHTADEHGEGLQTKQVYQQLLLRGLEIPLPLNIKAKYTIVMKKLDWDFFQNTPEEITRDVEDEAPYTVGTIEEIYLMAHHSIAKI